MEYLCAMNHKRGSTRRYLMRLLAVMCFLGCAAKPPEPEYWGGCVENEKYFATLKVQKQGVSALSQNDFANASRLFDQALQILGGDSLQSNMIDDTGMKLVLAKSEEAKGAVEVAANIKSRVLSSRLDAYRSKAHCNKD